MKYDRKFFQDLRVEMTNAFDVAIQSTDAHAKENVIIHTCDKYGLRMCAINDRSIVLFRPGCRYAVQCDVGEHRMVVKTLMLPKPL